MLLLAIVFNFDAGDLVDQLTQAVHVNRMESQDNLESAMRVSVGPGAWLCIIRASEPPTALKQRCFGPIWGRRGRRRLPNPVRRDRFWQAAVYN